MAEVKIILRDEGPEVDVSIDFGDAGADDKSHAHYMAMQIAGSILRSRQDPEAGE